MKKSRFTLSIPAHEFLAYYQGVARNVLTISVEGESVQFPAHVLRPYLTEQGIYGEFVLQCDQQNKFKSIKKVG